MEKLFMTKEDITLEILGRVKEFKKGEPHIWDTFVKVYDEYFVPYVPPSNIEIIEFDFGNKDYQFDYIGIKMENTEPEGESNE